MVHRLHGINLDMACRNGPIERCTCREIVDSKIKVRTHPICHVNQALYVHVSFMSLISESHHIHLDCHHIFLFLIMFLCIVLQGTVVLVHLAHLLLMSLID